MHVKETQSRANKLGNSVRSDSSFDLLFVGGLEERKGVQYLLKALSLLKKEGVRPTLKIDRSSKVIALSQAEAQQYGDIGVPEEKTVIIPNGIDLSEYSHLPPKDLFKKKLNIDEEERIVLYLGRIHRIKGIDILVKAFAEVIEKLDDVRLVIVGPDDGYLSACRNLVSQLKVEEKILFTGGIFDIEKLRALVDADVFVLPSRYETFPDVILEAEAAPENSALKVCFDNSCEVPLG